MLDGYYKPHSKILQLLKLLKQDMYSFQSQNIKYKLSTKQSGYYLIFLQVHFWPFLQLCQCGGALWWKMVDYENVKKVLSDMSLTWQKAIGLAEESRQGSYSRQTFWS